MATSGEYNYAVTGTNIMTEALELIGVLALGATIDSNDSTSVLRSLNTMIKGWQAKHACLWTQKEVCIFLQEDTYSYDLGPSGDHWCKTAPATQYLKTEVATAAAAAATSVTIDSVTGLTDTFDRNGIITAVTPGGAGAITLDGALVTSSVAYLSGERKLLIYSDGADTGVTFACVGTDGNGVAVTETVTGPGAGLTVYSTSLFKTVTSVTISGAGTGNIEVGQVGDHIGFEIADGTVQWTFFKAALSTTAQFVTALTSAVAVDNHVYIYTTRPPRPTEIIEARLNSAADTDRDINIKSRAEYMALSDKDSTGSANMVYYDAQRTAGVLKVWPACSDVQETLRLTVRIPIEDMDAVGNNPDFPQEWFDALSWNLAIRIAPKFGKKLDREFRMTAREFLTDAIEFDREYASTFIEVA